MLRRLTGLLGAARDELLDRLTGGREGGVEPSRTAQHDPRRSETMGKIEIRDVRAVVIFADRPRELADWYKKVFALSEFVGSEGFIGLATSAGVAIFIQRTSEGHTPGVGGIRPHFSVPDCDAALRALREAGAGKVLLPVTDTGDEHVAAIQDPEGNPIGLLAFKPGRGK
jgi:predicted enzyme related to lactoylglutathione lyase